MTNSDDPSLPGAADPETVAPDRVVAAQPVKPFSFDRWLLAGMPWVLSLVTLITGIVLTVTTNIVTDYDDDFSTVTPVWPAGLVLLGVGALSLIALFIIADLRASRRSHSPMSDPKDKVVA